jgi:hypothetical protein
MVDWSLRGVEIKSYMYTVSRKSQSDTAWSHVLFVNRSAFLHRPKRHSGSSLLFPIAFAKSYFCNNIAV